MKKGLSNVLNTVLIVLFVLVAAGIAWTILLPIVGRGGESVQAQTGCSEISVEPQRCLVRPGEGANNKNLIEVIIGVTQGTVEGFITTVEYDDATTVSQETDESIGIYETRVISFDNSSTSIFPVKAKVAATVKTESGEVVPCAESSVTVMCGTASEGNSCTSNSDCNSSLLRCVDGTCTFFDNRRCQNDNECLSGFECNNFGYCVRTGSPGSSGGGGGGDSGNGGCTDGDDDWYGAQSCGGYDCNDGNPDINPGMNEDCDNGIDDNCNELVDGDDSDCQITVPCIDGDGDGYGFPANNLCLHAEEDCDDYASETNPGVDEICDLRNNDCDDFVDEGCAEAPAGSGCSQVWGRQCLVGSMTLKRYAQGDYECNPPDTYCYMPSGPQCEGSLGFCQQAGCESSVPAGDADCRAQYGNNWFCCGER